MSYVITSTVTINATPQAVWNVLVDFPRYGEWSNFSPAEGTVRVGSRIKLRMPGFSFRPTISAARSEPSSTNAERVKRAGSV